MRTLLAAFVVFIALATRASADAGNDPQKFDGVGILSTGRFTIGGETTGITLKTDHGTYELSMFGELARKADGLNGKRVHVIGTLTDVAGIEIKGRRIVAVSSLAAVNPPNLMPICPMTTVP